MAKSGQNWSKVAKSSQKWPIWSISGQKWQKYYLDHQNVNVVKVRPVEFVLKGDLQLHCYLSINLDNRRKKIEEISRSNSKRKILFIFSCSVENQKLIQLKTFFAKICSKWKNLFFFYFNQNKSKNAEMLLNLFDLQ